MLSVLAQVPVITVQALCVIGLTARAIIPRKLLLIFLTAGRLITIWVKTQVRSRKSFWFGLILRMLSLMNLHSGLDITINSRQLSAAQINPAIWFIQPKIMTAKPLFICRMKTDFGLKTLIPAVKLQT